MPASRVMPTPESADLIHVIRDVAGELLLPRVAADEEAGHFPRDIFTTLGRIGVLGLPYPTRFGGGGQSYEVYLQVLEELASAWTSVAVGTSVHVLSCFPVAFAGTAEQQEQWLPDMIGGELLGAYCLSEPHSGSDPGSMRTRAVRDGDHYVINGAKSWTTHGGHADFYTVMARTSDEGSHGISCFLVPGDAQGLSADPPERKMGLTSSPTATMTFDNVVIHESRRIGAEGDGLAIAFAGLAAGRLGIASVATGLSQAALDLALLYAQSRESFGRPIVEHQGVAFLIADMDARIESSRATYLSAARLVDQGRPFRREAAIAKLIATDNAMATTEDAVQVLGGAGYTKDFAAERYMREAKVMQIFEGTNQIQRIIISRDVVSAPPGTVVHRAS